LTAIPAQLNPRKLAGDFALTNRLRTAGTRNILQAAPGVRFISQGLAYGYQFGKGVANEDAPLWLDRTPKQFALVLAALLELERQTAEAGGLVLRLGRIYGAGSSRPTGRT
jgi:hypothetical protein